MRSFLARARRACTFVLAVFLTAHPCVAAAMDKDQDHDHDHDRGFKVYGVVAASDGTAVARATVTLTGPGEAKHTHSDSHGVFDFDHVSGGTYTLGASAPGYQPISLRTVTIASDDTTLRVVMSRATTNSLAVIGEVQASAGATVSTASAPTVSMSAQAAAAAGATSVAPMVWDQLSTTPVIPLGGGSNATQTFAVRGPDPTETLVDVDGHPMNNGNTGDFDLSLVDPAALQEVQLVYGIAPSSLVGPNTIGGGINIVTLQPTSTPAGLLRLFGGSYGTAGGTAQSTGTDGRWGYAFSLHGVSSDGSVNQSVPSNNESLQSVGSGSWGNSLITKLRYQLGGDNGYGYLQLDFRNQTVVKDESALLTNYTPPGFSGGGGDDVQPLDGNAGGYQSFAGTWLQAHDANYGFDAQLPLGKAEVGGAPATMLQFSHLTSLNAQSVTGPGEATQPYLYNQRDLLGDDWLQLDQRFNTGLLSFKYDLATESLTTNYVQGQVTAQSQPVGAPVPLDRPPPPVQTLPIAQTQRYAVLRYNGDPTSHIHYSLATYYSDYSTFGTSFDPRAGFVWTPSGNTAVRASVGTTFQTPQLSELVVPPPADRVPVGGIIYIGNPNLQPDHATDYDLGFEQIARIAQNPLQFSLDLYQTNLRAPSNQLNVQPIPGCQTKHNPVACPISYPVNAGDGIYRGIDVSADQQLWRTFHVRAGWDVDSSYLTAIPPSIQDGTLVPYQQSLGQPLHKAYLAIEQTAASGWNYGAQLNYEGYYNELNRSPYATLDAHVAYVKDGYEFGLYGTNLTSAYSSPFTIVGGGIPYGTLPGQPVINPDAYVLQGAQVTFAVTRTF